MNVRIEDLKLSAMAVAVAGATMMSAAHAQDEAAALKMPSSFVELGVLGADSSSARFGEYNGINKSGGKFLGGLSIRGGDAYGESGGTMRWSIYGSDLGLTTRTLGGTVADQGRWSLGIRYDELRHNLTDSFQTPYQGTMGGNSWTLPAGFVTATSRNLTPAQVGAFQQMDIYSSRKNTSISAGLNLSSQWEIKFDYNHLDQSGAKLMGFGASRTTPPGGTATNEFVSILPAPTSYKTDTVNLALNWTGDKGHASASYYGSYFRNDFDRINFVTWGVANTTQTMSTPPGNDLHQFNVSGGYALLAKTKVAGNLSYARNTQNQGFAYDAFMMNTPTTQTSANALVVNSHADFKLTDQNIKNTTLTAGYKYDLRDNRTASNIYNFWAIDGNAGNRANYPNTPLSIKKQQVEIAADYRINRDHHVRVAYSIDMTDRWCGQYAVNAVYTAGTNCVVAKSAKEDKADVTYRFQPFTGVNVRVGYSQGTRITNYDTLARAAFIGANGGGPGLNAGDYIGFHPFLDANRTQRALRGHVNWEVNDKLSLGLSGRYTADQYGATYGIESGNSWSLNLDAAYRYSENGALTGFVSQQHMDRTMTDLQRSPTLATAGATATAIAVPSGATWTDRLRNDDTTFGVGFKHTGLFSGKLDLTGDLTQSRATSAYSNLLNYSTVTNLASGSMNCFNPFLLSCGDTPVIKIRITQLKLNGTYIIDKKSKVNLLYMFQRLGGDDYYYNGYQQNFTPTQVLPTNQQLGNHAVSVLAASYIYSF